MTVFSQLGYTLLCFPQHKALSLRLSSSAQDFSVILAHCLFIICLTFLISTEGHVKHGAFRLE